MKKIKIKTLRILLSLIFFSITIFFYLEFSSRILGLHKNTLNSFLISVNLITLDRFLILLFFFLIISFHYAIRKIITIRLLFKYVIIVFLYYLISDFIIADDLTLKQRLELFIGNLWLILLITSLIYLFHLLFKRYNYCFDQKSDH